ncbi:MAG: 3'(2'),5'-bisphosphate nucleotidase CysQ [Nitratireductor sp.]
MENKPTTLDLSNLESDLALVKQAAKKAGEIALSYFKSDNEIWEKSGGSPVSAADFAVDTYLKETLLKARPDYGWLSEETEDDTRSRLSKSTIFVVDPIDGTRGFLEGKSQWCVSIAIVQDNLPILGVLECPVLEETYWAALNGGAYLNGTQLDLPKDKEVKTVTGSRILNVELAKSHKDTLSVTPFIPSLAYRIAMVANNAVDAGVARGGARDWDLAAADIILQEAGGMLTDLDSKPRDYNRMSTGGSALIAASKSRHSTILTLAKSDGFLQ